MALQFDVLTRNAMLDAIEAAWGLSPTMKVFQGTKPANCAAADAGTVLATLALPSDFLAAASGGSKAKSGTWEDTSADATGNAQYFRIYDSGAVCKGQGSVTATGGGGDMTVDNVAFAATQDFLITGFTLNAGNA
jgi:hypothetical protein